VLANANPPLTEIGQQVIQGGLHALLYHLKDMHTLNHQIEGVMEFQSGLSVKEFVEIF
jgi:hypothetical protein